MAQQNETNDRSTTGTRIAIIGTSVLLGGALAAGGLVGSQTIEPGLTARAEQALQAAGFADVRVAFRGREAVLDSPTASPAELAEAEKLVESLDGVRWATVADSAAGDGSAEETPGAGQPAAGPTLSVQSTPDGVAVTGSVATQQQADELQAAAEQAFGAGTQVDITVDAAVGDAEWVASAATLFDALAPVSDLEFSLDSSGAVLSGTAADVDTVTDGLVAGLHGLPLDAELAFAQPDPDETQVLTGTDILFLPDSVALTDVALTTLDDIAAVLLRYPDLRIEVTGHIAIPTGTEADAIAFSEQRAQAVVDRLAELGVDPGQMTIVGAGTDDAVGDNTTPEGAALNRRVSIAIKEN